MLFLVRVCSLRVAKLMLLILGHSLKMWPTCSSSWVFVIIIEDLLCAFLKWRRRLHYWPEKISNLFGVVCSKLHLSVWKSCYVVLLCCVCLTIPCKLELWVMLLIFVWVVFWSNLTRWPTSGTLLSIIPNAWQLLSAIIALLTRNILLLGSAWSAGDISLSEFVFWSWQIMLH